jgi:hypothetical protein
MATELERELAEARKVYIEAIDNGDEQTENEYADIVSAIAKLINEGNPKFIYIPTMV